MARDIDLLQATLCGQARYEQAEPLLRELLELRRRTHPDGHETVAAALASLGLALLQLDRPGEAEPILQECLRIRETSMPERWLRFNAMSLLGGALAGQGRHDEAEPLLLEGYAGMEGRPDASRRRVHEARRRLRQYLLEHRGDDTANGRRAS